MNIMRTMAVKIFNYIPGLVRYHLKFSNTGYYLNLPNLMDKRIYFNDKIIDMFDGNVHLPKRNDLVEYDFRMKQWYIVDII